MTLKDKILLDLTGIKNPSLLAQIFEFIQEIKREYSVVQESNKNEIFKFAGTINDSDAEDINHIIDNEFNNIEGEW